jgi:hypothetical protein
MTRRNIEIRRKMTDQKPVLIMYFENNADKAALVGFRFWRDIRNREKRKYGVQIIKIYQKIKGQWPLSDGNRFDLADVIKIVVVVLYF